MAQITNLVRKTCWYGARTQQNREKSRKNKLGRLLSGVHTILNSALSGADESIRVPGCTYNRPEYFDGFWKSCTYERTRPLKAWSEAGRNFAAIVIFLRTDCVARNLYDQSILVDQPAQVTAARELWLAQVGRLPIPFCGSLAKTLLPGGTTQNPYAQTHSGIRAQRAHEHH